MKYIVFPEYPNSVNRENDDGSTSCIPVDAANADYQQYLAWLEEGNVPEEWQPEELV